MHYILCEIAPFVVLYLCVVTSTDLAPIFFDSYIINMSTVSTSEGAKVCCTIKELTAASQHLVIRQSHFDAKTKVYAVCVAEIVGRRLRDGK